jgi:Xaa-Pro aminopeptidase
MTKTNNLDVPAVQSFLRGSKLDGWLIYDFFGLNKIAQSLFEFSGHMLTRRWFYWIPTEGSPTLVLHWIERDNFPPVEGDKRLYSSWLELEASLRDLLKGAARVAMEYSPGAAIPTVSWVDGGTLDVVRGLGIEVASSANLVQYFWARWTPDQLQSHIRAAEQIDKIKDEGYALIRRRIEAGEPVTEYDVQRYMVQRLEEEGLVTMAPPMVSVNENASNPHYSASESVHAPIREGDFVLIDIWAKEKSPQAVYADITWNGYVGTEVPARIVEVFEVVAAARDLAVDFLRQAAARGETTQGWKVDRVVREFITQKGYGEYFVHRTGHSIDTEDHGKGVNIDSLETKDTREIIPGLGFSIEPGIYLPDFGIRCEINVYYGENGPEVYTRSQDHVLAIMKEC